MKTKTVAKHTPGPWIVGEHHCVLAGPENGHLTACFNYTNGLGIVPQEANARLIAAAPYLLAVAKMAEVFYVSELEAIDDCDHEVGICRCEIVSELETLREAIAKAEDK